MRKINKDCDLSTVYKAWEEKLEQNQTPHPKYNSTNGKYYWDIVMQLHKCQKGLCAYTEQALCDEELFAADCWENGRYKNAPPAKAGREGELEHFDESLKSKKKDEHGKQDWLWSNLFVVAHTPNNRKRTQAVDDILKPDHEDYNPFQLLDYDTDLHRFFPSRNLDEIKAERVKNMILVLGINDVHSKRRKYLKNLFIPPRIHAKNDYSAAEQYPTAYEFIRRKMEDGTVDLKAVTF